MKTKKSPSANLENKRLIFLQIGIIISLTLALTAFELRSYDASKINLKKPNENPIADELPPITVIPSKPKPKPVVVTDIKIITDDPEIEPDDYVINAETSPEAVMPEWAPELAEEKITEEEIFVAVEDKPEFPGGTSALFRYLNKNINYPLMAIETGVRGVVYVQFIVEKDGSITDVNLYRGIGGGCDEEAIRVVQGMPHWKPGKQFNKAVRVRYTLPVRFVLQ